MGRLCAETVDIAQKFYTERGGHLITIAGHPGACEASSLLSRHCDEVCRVCSANAPVISMGEIDPRLHGVGLFAVGLLDVEDPKTCRLVNEIHLYQSAEPPPRLLVGSIK